MINIAVIEDEKYAADTLIQHLRDYEKKTDGIVFEISHFDHGLRFLDSFKSNFDIIFIDMQMPQLSGIDTARRIYEKDKTAVLIFVTNLRQYAILGYEVNALAYMLKPVTYESVADKLDKALSRLVSRPRAKTLLLRENTVIRLEVSDILYVEIMGHTLIYHTNSGEYEVRGRISDVEEELAGFDFSRCHKGYLVNLGYIKRIENNSVEVGTNVIPISRGRLKPFISSYLEYLRKGGI